jgi:hypothetical protein
MESKLVYSASRAAEASPEALVLHCSDHRFQTAFNEFLTHGLELRSYGLLSIPGGGHFISLETYLPKFAKIGFQSVSFLVKRSRPRRIILIGHDDCLFFKERAQFFFFEADLNEKQFANLKKAREVIHSRYPDLAVDIYFADVQKDSVQFVKVG